MGNHSPGKIKREGRRAYANGCDATDNPYKIKLRPNGYVPVAADYWYEGWKEEQANELETEEKEMLLANRSIYEIPLSEFKTLGDLIAAIEKHKKEDENGDPK